MNAETKALFPKLICVECEEQISPFGLKKHYKVKHPLKQIPKIKCAVCGKEHAAGGFYDHASKAHGGPGGGRAEWNCDECDHKCTSKQGMDNHKHMRHPPVQEVDEDDNTRDDDDSSDEEDPPKKKKKAKKQYVCPFDGCLYHAGCASNLKRHVKVCERRGDRRSLMIPRTQRAQLDEPTLAENTEAIRKSYYQQPEIKLRDSTAKRLTRHDEKVNDPERYRRRREAEGDRDQVNGMKRTNRRFLSRVTMDTFFRVLEYLQCKTLVGSYNTGACTYCDLDPAGGIDRPISTAAYSELNAVPCCTGCNKSKGAMTSSQFVNRSRAIALFSQGRGIYTFKPVPDDTPVAPRHQSVFSKVKERAEDDGLDFRLTRDDLKIYDNPNTVCAYCGIQRTICTLQVDRVDSSVGYIPENSVPCCAPCNLYKNEYRKKDIIDKALHITRKFHGLTDGRIDQMMVEYSKAYYKVAMEHATGSSSSASPSSSSSSSTSSSSSEEKKMEIKDDDTDENAILDDDDDVPAPKEVVKKKCRSKPVAFRAVVESSDANNVRLTQVLAVKDGVTYHNPKCRVLFLEDGKTPRKIHQIVEMSVQAALDTNRDPCMVCRTAVFAEELRPALNQSNLVQLLNNDSQVWVSDNTDIYHASEVCAQTVGDELRTANVSSLSGFDGCDKCVHLKPQYSEEQKRRRQVAKSDLHRKKRTREQKDHVAAQKRAWKERKKKEKVVNNCLNNRSDHYKKRKTQETCEDDVE
jgi:hypothetical protein